ncbi:Ku protein [Cupriavidus plantarum]|uniref:non-homologous end joining protein Ku n=1 Tax=Cupriavidus plantarum TaxID=942865 RepID=UPI0015CC4E5F|nr:Ku protein [Cupriavidus plantarum]NYI01062.1 DNA end-binding protein Ku [Cupriavidus plantarum]
MSRVIWKGAISFGLVNIPVVLKPASRTHTLDLDMLDKRDMAPIGYQRINKHTGKPVESDDIVKGYAYEKDEYVVLSDEDFKQANVEATQTVDIVSFVDAASIPPYYFETPYYLEPDKRGERGYALLHETMRRTGRAALAMVVLRNRQHLAALLVSGKALVLNTMRFADEVLPIEDLALPKGGKQGASAREVDMAEKLVEDMTEDWAPEQYRDTYRDDLMAVIDAKIKSGNTHLLTPASEDTAPATKGAKVIDMMALLRDSLGKRGKPGKRAAEKGSDEATAAEEAPAKVSAKVSAKGSAKGPAKGAARKSAPSKARAKKTVATKKPAAKKAVAKQAAAKQAAARKPTAKNAAAKKAPARKAA